MITHQKSSFARLCSVMLSVVIILLVQKEAMAVTTPMSISDLSRYFWFSNLSEMSSGVVSRQASSYDRTDGNGDSALAMGFDQESTGVVLLECDGPGVITRIWCGGHIPIHLYIYLDGCETPVVDMGIEELTSGEYYPFVKPLVGGMEDSSGGYYCYVPIPFAKSLKVVADCPGYYNINYQKYPVGSKIVSFTGQENVDSLVEIMNHIGENPTGSSEIDTRVTGDLASGESMTLFETSQGGAINEMKLNIPQLTDFTACDRTCRDYTQSSEYTLSIAPDNDGVALKKLIDIAGSGAYAMSVLVDGETVGDWKYDIEDMEATGQIETFYIPTQYTQGKSSIRVSTQINKAISDFYPNEYYLEAYSLVDGFYTRTDYLDVGDEKSEQEHDYQASEDRGCRIQTITLNSQYNNAQFSSRTLTETGRTNKGASQFTVTVHPNHDRVRVVRLIDRYSINQKIKLYVDGDVSGMFAPAVNDRDAVAFPYPTGSNNCPFYDWVINISATRTRGKSSLDLTFEYMSGKDGVSEYSYRIYCLVDGRWILTDTLDVGNEEDESAHRYEVTGQTWNGANTYDYYVADQWITPTTAVETILDQLYVKVTCDDLEEPTVYAPVGAFFGVGQTGLDQSSLLMFGLDDDNNLYFYFQQPYRFRCKVELVNHTEMTLTGLASSVVSDPTFVFTDLTGYLKGQYHDQTTETRADYFTYLDVEGSGHLVAIINTDIGSLVSERDYVETDESFFVDGRRDFSGNGTGKEDMYNGSFCFENGTFACPLHANPYCDTVNYGDGHMDRIIMVRTFLSDRINFRDGMQFLMECYFPGERQKTLALYYHQEEPAMTLTDTLDASSEESLGAHGYQAVNAISFSATKTWPGYYYQDTRETIQGFSVSSSSFTVSIEPNNDGVVIYRTFSHTANADEEDRAVVSVNGSPLGIWTAENVSMGTSTLHRFGSDAFVIPAELTAGRETLTIELETVDGSPWHDVCYEVYSLRTAQYTCGDVNYNGKIDAADALLVLQHSVELCELGTLPRKAADVNLDGAINASDALGILQYSVGLLKQLPIA